MSYFFSKDELEKVQIDKRPIIWMKILIFTLLILLPVSLGVDKNEYIFVRFKIMDFWKFLFFFIL